MLTLLPHFVMAGPDAILKLGYSVLSRAVEWGANAAAGSTQLAVQLTSTGIQLTFDAAKATSAAVSAGQKLVNTQAALGTGGVKLLAKASSDVGALTSAATSAGHSLSQSVLLLGAKLSTLF